MRISGRGYAACLAVLAISGVLTVGPIVRADRQTGSEDAQALVRQLGAPSFAARESASRRLAEMGAAAKEPLISALADPDAEVRERARRILEFVLERDFQVRLEAFSADLEGSDGHGLPGWERYRELAGEDLEARQLFVQMQRAESLLLEAAEADAPSAGELLEARMLELRETDDFGQTLYGRQATPGRVAALLFVGADRQVPLSDEAAMFVSNSIHQQPFKQAMQAASGAASLRRLLAAWVGRTFAGASAVNLQSLMAAAEYDLKEGLAVALHMVEDPLTDPSWRPYAILGVGKFGGLEHLSGLEPLLSDETLCVRGDEFQCQVRDVALVAMLRLAGEDPREYGFDRLQSSEVIQFDPSRLGFSDDEKRQRALARWREWSAEHIKPAEGEH